MPVTYNLDGKLLRLDLVDSYQPQDIPEAFLAGLEDPACPDSVALLLDVTRSSSLAERAPNEIRKVAEFLGPFAERIGGRCAVFATSNVHYGLSRMGAVYCEGVGVSARVFRDLGDALEWLGIETTGSNSPSDLS